MIVAIVAIASGGCGASVSVDGGIISNDGPYKAAWERGWETVTRDAAPYRPTATSPGVCNAGGVKAECYEADSRTVADLRELAMTLRHVQTPSEYRHANVQTLAGVAGIVQGLELRMSSLGPGDYRLNQREVWFHQSKPRLLQAHDLLQRAYASFPQWDRPMPAPSL